MTRSKSNVGRIDALCLLASLSFSLFEWLTSSSSTSTLQQTNSTENGTHWSTLYNCTTVQMRKAQSLQCTLRVSSWVQNLDNRERHTHTHSQAHIDKCNGKMLLQQREGEKGKATFTDTDCLFVYPLPAN